MAVLLKKPSMMQCIIQTPKTITLLKYWKYIALVILVIFIMNKCQDEPETITVTTIEYIKTTDTITETIIEKPEIKYIITTTTIKGKDSIIYVDRKTNKAIKVNQFSTILKSNNATTDLSITVIGELLDVTGTISYKEKVTTLKTTKTVHASGLFVYGKGSIKSKYQNIQIGLDYVIKNKWIIGTSVDYNNFTKSANFNVKIGFKIF